MYFDKIYIIKLSNQKISYISFKFLQKSSNDKIRPLH
jgi:hypothetical protein